MRFCTLAIALMCVAFMTVIATSAPQGNGNGSGGSQGNGNGNGNGQGNGAPHGAHFTLNLIGVSPTHPQVGQGNGHRIFVRRTGTTKILLGPGESFRVTDPNGQDGVARLELPHPDADGTGVTRYSVYVRPLGPPGQGSIVPGGMVPGPGPDGEWGTEDDEMLVSTSTIVEVITRKGKARFKNVSKQLLYGWVDLDGDGTLDRVPLFGGAFEDVFWQYDSQGLKRVQLRFYPIATDTN